eukprot:TRINITY_DN1414_c0_g1_i1.p1 TRINITY_DN1414_c0_g1~~TRINITY_DN1414_c0_g1_i1.p1  ORF type:complete len:583 (+),score=69.23 TRINITY_DN1414_c0_g1_i1:50-1798(+)
MDDVRNTSFTGSLSGLSGSLKNPKEKRRSRRRTIEGEPSEGNITEQFPEVPSSEKRVEKPIWCAYGKRVGNMHITRNYLCWGGMGETVVLHFGEITSLEKGGTIIDSIEIKCKARISSPSRCAGDKLHDYGPGISTCAVCGASPCWNRGCKRCNLRLCESCFNVHKNSTSDSIVVRHVFKPRDLDRVYTIIHSLWKAHLRIPVEKRQGRAVEPSAPSAPRQSSETTELGSEGEDHHADSNEEAMLQKLPYNANITKEMFSDPSVPRKSPSPGVQEVSCPLSRVFKVLIGDSSTFIKSYHDKRKDESFENAPWTHGESGKASGTRMITYITKTPLGKKNMFEAQRYWWTQDSITMHCSSQAPDITFGSSFRTETLFDFRLAGGKVTISSCSHVLFLKSVGLMSGTIKKTAGRTCDDTNAIFCQDAAILLKQKGGEVTPAPEPEATVEVAEKKSLLSRTWDIATWWCIITLVLCMTAIITIATSSFTSAVALSLPPLATTAAEIHDLARVNNVGFISRLPSQELLAATGLAAEEALPILYDLLAREVLRTQWIQLLSTVAMFLSAVIAVLCILKKLFSTLPSSS